MDWQWPSTSKWAVAVNMCDLEINKQIGYATIKSIIDTKK